MIGNWIDLIIIFFTLFSFFTVVNRSFIKVSKNFISFALAFFVSLFFYKIFSDFVYENFQLNRSYSNVLGFFVSLSALKIFLEYLLSFIVRKFNIRIRIDDNFFYKFSSYSISLIYSLFIAFVLFSITYSLSFPSFIVNELNNSTSGKVVQKNYLLLNGYLSNIFGDFLVTVINNLDFITVGSENSESIDLGFEVLDASVREDLENSMLKRVNEERASRNLQPLSMDEEARELARDYGKYLFENGIFSHTDLEGKGPSERMEDRGIKFVFSGENLALASNLEEAHKGLMESEGHRENILYPFFGKVGIGVIDGGSYGMIFVQEFLD